MSRTDSRMTRRRVIGSGASLLAAAAVPLRGQSTPAPREQAASAADLTGRVARYMAAARQQALPADVVREAKHRILDTLAAMISGADLIPGRAAISFARSHGGKNVAAVVASDVTAGPIEAAFANGVLAHADETDDSHAPSL